jgi:glyoxylase-like metal-dependent hydrolase (beta-lactamase superfamily II)
VDRTSKIAPSITVVATPGHTPGHQSVLLEVGDDTVLFTGDLLVHAVQLVDPHIAYSNEVDPETARKSRVELLRDGVTLATAHLSEPFTFLTRPH